MSKIIHIKVNSDIKRKLYCTSFAYHLSQSAMVDIISRYYSPYVEFRPVPTEEKLDIETTMKIKTENNPYSNQWKSLSELYTRCIYWYYNQNKLDEETREKIKHINKAINKTAKETKDPNALYNEICRMNYRANKEHVKKKN